MRKIISVVLSLLLLLAVICPLTVSAEITMVEVTKSVSVRSQPGFNGAKIVLAKPGTQYMYLGTEGSWYAIQMDDGKKGYLPKDSTKLVTAQGIPTKNAQDAFSSIANILQHSKGFETELPETFFGKTALAVYYDLNGKPEELSTEMLSSEGSYWSIPEELLATKMDEADWALLIFPTFTDMEGSRVQVNVFPVDMKNAVYYQPYLMDDRVTILDNDERTYELDSTLRGIYEFIYYPKWEKAFRLENDEDYQAGLRYMKEEKYYSALESFRMSYLEEADELAQKCIQPWPKTGEIWHHSSIKGRIPLTVKVNQSSERAMLVRIYKSDTLVACLFIGGSGQATTKLPAGTYVIKDGTGYEWYGLKEAFGREGSYEIMTFGANDSEQVTLQSRYEYTIRINVSDGSSSGEGIGSKYEDWDGFAQ